jgi:hypothetical protein
MDRKLSFETEELFSRFKQVEKVKIENRTLKIETNENCIVFLFRNKLYHVVHKNELFNRWVLIDGVLHYIQRINHWMGGTKCNYIKAEV